MSFYKSDSSASGSTWNRDGFTIDTSASTNVGSNETNAKVTGVRILLITQSGYMRKLWLPEIPEGRVQFGENKDGLLHYISFEGKNGKWILSCVKPAAISDTHGNRFLSTEIKDNCLYIIEYLGTQNVLFTECADSDGSVFTNYWIDQLCEIRIGRTEDNDLVVPNRFVSKNHAVISRNRNEWSIRDLGSSNGTFVNGIKTNSQELRTGDIVSIMSLQIIIGVDFISMNDGNGRAKVMTNRLNRADSTGNFTGQESIALKTQGKDEQLFNRSPRKRYTFHTEPIIVEAPPMSLNGDTIPMVLRMGGSVVMSTASMLAGNITSMLGMVLFPVLTQKYTDKQKKEYEKKRVAKYTEYLKLKRKELEREKAYEEKALDYNYPAIASVLTYTENRQRLWERRNYDDDFLVIRLGYGNTPMKRQCDYPPRRFEMDEDALLEDMYRLVESNHELTNVPILFSLTENRVCGILGWRQMQLGLVKQMILQIALLHSYDEVKIIILADEKEMDLLESVKFLPHIWDDQKNLRFLATSISETYRIGEYLNGRLEKDIEKSRELTELLKDRAYFVVFALNKHLFDSMEVLKSVMKHDKNCGISVIAVFEDLPKECTKIIELKTANKHRLVNLNQIDQPSISFASDKHDRRAADESAKKVSNLKLKAVSQGYSLPKMVSFLELFNVGRVEHLNPKKRWRESNPVSSLAAPVGIGTDGEQFALDLHEKYQGPHGLVAGMTGSGKSEFLITYILSLAINYHPNEVAFVLIDYKGGGLAGAFDDPVRGIHLPHLVGTITNLDGSAIQRSMISIESELKRRQRIFNEAKSIADEGTMDIYSYQKLFRKGVVSEPLPHLFIISDEFAELKAQEPDFMDQLISAARIGRSLGVHLILATQKPAGVVDDQINSNSKFRVCLKVQTRSDSDEMLRRPDAAELKDTGRFYLQVGYNEYFALGQSAWCGASYEPQDEVIVHRDDYVQFIDNTGQTVVQVKPAIEKNDSGITQLVAIVKYLSRLAEKEQIKPRKLWLDPMPQTIPIQSLCRINRQERAENSTICAKVGMIDDTENQRQFPLILDFRKSQNLMIVGNTKSGKTTVVETLLYSLIENYTPEEVNYYILDYAGRMLSVFDHTSYCGGVWGEGDEKEVEKLFQMLEEIIAERKAMFLKATANSFEAYLEVQKIPMIFVLIDNISGLRSWEEGDSIYHRMNIIMRDGNYVGIKFVITAASEDDILYSIKGELDLRLVLSAKNKYEYGDILGLRSNIEPARNPGRGLCKYNDKPMEMQIARYTTEGSERARIQSLKDYVASRSALYSDSKPAKKLLVVDETETYESFCSDIPLGRIPLGYSVADAKKVSIPLKQLFCMSLYFGNPTGVQPVTTNYILAGVREKMHLIVVKGENSIFDTEIVRSLLRDSNSEVKTLSCTTEDSERLKDIMIEEINYRKEFRNQFCEKKGIPTDSTDTMRMCRSYIRENTYPLLVFFEDFAAFCENASDFCQQVFQQIMLNGSGYNYYFVACYYPDKDEKLRSNLMHTSFNPDQFVLLYGGQFDKQNLASLPFSYRQIEKPSRNYNTCLMQYHGGLYPILTPCGDIFRRSDDPDDEDIIS